MTANYNNNSNWKLLDLSGTITKTTEQDILDAHFNLVNHTVNEKALKQDWKQTPNNYIVHVVNLKLSEENINNQLKRHLEN